MNEPGGEAAAAAPVELTGDPRVDALLARFAAVVGELAELDLTGLVRLDGPSCGLHAVGRAVEAGRRALGAFDTHYVSAVEAGDEPARYAKTSTAVFLRDQHRLGIGEARRRVALPTPARPGPGSPATRCRPGCPSWPRRSPPGWSRPNRPRWCWPC